jgi:hypothetical protein
MIRSPKTLLAGLGMVSALFILFTASTAIAAGPQFLITWKATGSYAPSLYQGKVLPTYGSQITASLEIVSASGNIADISGKTIYWYLNDTLLGGGTGVQRITFPPFGDAPNAMTLKVELPNYNGSFLIHTVTIPMAQPHAVIEAPYPAGQFSLNPVTVTALPYFFNVSSPNNLSYSWSVNSQTGSNSENPNMAQITLPAGTPAGTSFAVSLQVQNPTDATQAAASTNLIYQPSLH